MDALRLAAAIIPGFKKAYSNMLPKGMVMGFKKTIDRAKKEMALS